MQTRRHRLRVDPIPSRSFKIEGLIRGVERRLENNGDYFFSLKNHAEILVASEKLSVRISMPVAEHFRFSSFFLDIVVLQ